MLLLPLTPTSRYKQLYDRQLILVEAVHHTKLGGREGGNQSKSRKLTIELVVKRIEQVTGQVEEEGEVLPRKVAVAADSVVVVCHPHEGNEMETNHRVIKKFRHDGFQAPKSKEHGEERSDREGHPNRVENLVLLQRKEEFTEELEELVMTEPHQHRCY